MSKASNILKMPKKAFKPGTTPHTIDLEKLTREEILDWTLNFLRPFYSNWNRYRQHISLVDCRSRAFTSRYCYCVAGRCWHKPGNCKVTKAEEMN